ncbi:MAG: transglutaminase family protein [Rhodobacteraceae bacterium]|jgi:transglutaminase-like putative cysteine protease|nr:transglutaminase family protein [Paracoccaceae bacterium]
MHLTVRHTTRYRFDPPARGIVQSLRLVPGSSGSQTVQSWTVDVPGARRGSAFRDGAGDHVETVAFRGPVDTVEITVTGTVATRDTAGVLKGVKEAVLPAAYLRTTRATRPSRALDALAAGTAGADGPLARAHALSAAVADAIAYAPGETHATTSAAEALDAGQGVCQDHAHAMIAVAVAAGLPARYVTGYLYTGDDPDSRMGEASHAWAEVWVDGLGWVGFDPANRCCPDDRYIRLGSGFDAADAAPIRGVARGEVAETLDVAVAVAQSQSQTQQQ